MTPETFYYLRNKLAKARDAEPKDWADAKSIARTLGEVRALVDAARNKLESEANRPGFFTTGA